MSVHEDTLAPILTIDRPTSPTDRHPATAPRAAAKQATAVMAMADETADLFAALDASEAQWVGEQASFAFALVNMMRRRGCRVFAARYGNPN